MPNAEAAYQAALDAAFSPNQIEANGASLIELGKTRLKELNTELAELNQQLYLFEQKVVDPR